MGAAQAAVRDSAVYCQRERGSWEMFAAKILPDGKLSFGVSLWQGLQNIGVMGIAERHGASWEYASSLDSSDPGDHCRLAIRFNAKGDTVVTADPKAGCHNSGGEGTEIGTVRFRRKDYLGAVTVELDEPESFFSGSGLLNSARCTALAGE